MKGYFFLFSQESFKNTGNPNPFHSSLISSTHFLTKSFHRRFHHAKLTIRKYEYSKKMFLIIQWFALSCSNLEEKSKFFTPLGLNCGPFRATYISRGT